MEQITNTEGKIAVKYRTSNPKTVVLKDKGITYQFSTSPNGTNVYCNYLSMAWVDPADLDLIMRIQERICCGKSGQAFHLANALDVSLWTTGKRP